MFSFVGTFCWIFVENTKNKWCLILWCLGFSTLMFNANHQFSANGLLLLWINETYQFLPQEEPNLTSSCCYIRHHSTDKWPKASQRWKTNEFFSFYVHLDNIHAALVADISVVTRVAEGTIKNSYKDLYPHLSRIIPDWFANEEDIKSLLYWNCLKAMAIFPYSLHKAWCLSSFEMKNSSPCTSMLVKIVI